MHPWAALNSPTDLRVTLSNVLCLDFNQFPQFQTYMHTFKGRNVVWYRWQSMTCAILIWMHHNASSCFIAPWHWATGFSPALKKQAGCIMMYHPHHPFVLVLSGPFLPGLASSSTAGSAAGSTAAAPELASSVQNSASIGGGFGEFLIVFDRFW